MSLSRRSAPAFQIDTRPQPRFQSLLALGVTVLAGLAVFAAGRALAAHLPKAMPLWLLSLLILPAAVLAWRWAQVKPRRLRWDGQVWWLHDERDSLDEVQVQIEVLFDFGTSLLLRARPVLHQTHTRRLFSPAIYMPLAQSGQAQWPLLRACLYSARPEHSSL